MFLGHQNLFCGTLIFLFWLPIQLKLVIYLLIWEKSFLCVTQPDHRTLEQHDSFADFQKNVMINDKSIAKLTICAS